LFATLVETQVGGKNIKQMRMIKIIKRVLVRILVLTVFLVLSGLLFGEDNIFLNVIGHCCIGLIIGVELELGSLYSKSKLSIVLTWLFIIFLISLLSYLFFKHYYWGLFALGLLIGPFFNSFSMSNERTPEEYQI